VSTKSCPFVVPAGLPEGSVGFPTPRGQTQLSISMRRTTSVKNEGCLRARDFSGQSK